MALRLLCIAFCTLVLCCSLGWSQKGESLPPGFIDELVVGGWNQPIDLAFLPDGRVLVAEKAGLVWMVEDGVKSAQPVIDITEEVGDAGSRGLKSLAVDPNFASNARVYLIYDVDRHHLFFFGTPQYDPLATDNIGPTVARITRFKLDAQTAYTTTVPNSRFVLVGESASTGFPLVDGHQCGMLRFGVDGSLLASCGDGAEVKPDYGGGAENAQALAEGILAPIEDVGSFRAQLVDSLSGKLIRINPETGNGLASNPFFNPMRPRSARSRVWASGFRNPFRFGVAANSAPGPNHPGTILIGDVGRSNWEEINRCYEGGQNFGWPLFEGMQVLSLFSTVPIENKSAPNPLFGQPLPGGGTCTQEFFTFQELLVQESLNPPSWPNPCSASLAIPASALPAMHSRPTIDWNHVGPARAGGFKPNGTAAVFQLDSPDSPITGDSFRGSCAMGGAWYEQGSYPTEFEHSFLFSDFTDSWIRHLRFDSAGVPIEVDEIAEAVGQVVSMAIDPISGDLYYLQLSTLPMLPGSLVHLAYYPNNTPPQAVASRSPIYGPSSLSVQFDAGNSSDPEAAPLAYQWDFGDGTPTSGLRAPVHVFPSRDVTSGGTFIAQVFELEPPQTINTIAGLFPAVVNDGVYMNPSAPEASELYFTFYDGTDPDPEDWVGYEWSGPQVFHQLVYQEGVEVGDAGGWFDSLTVDVRVNGVWTEVTGLAVSPPYPGQNGLFCEIFELAFDPIEGDAVRLRGVPGGTDGYVSVGELRAITGPTPTGLPTRYDVSLVVRDDVNLTSQVGTSVWIDNTPPTVALVSPLNGATYDPTVLQEIFLDASSFDAESGAELSCEWQASLHHNDHAHPEPIIDSCSSPVVLGPHPVSSEIYYWELTLTVTDPQGLPTAATHLIYPEPPSLISDSYAVSLSQGGTTELNLVAGPAHASELYQVLMSATGTFPGLVLSGVALPLNYDSLFILTLKHPKLRIFSGFRGQLDANGEASASLTVPPNADPSLAGFTIQFAYLTLGPTGTVVFASNPTPLTFVE